MMRPIPITVKLADDVSHLHDESDSITRGSWLLIGITVALVAVLRIAGVL